jgi:hypothetical protein
MSPVEMKIQDEESIQPEAAAVSGGARFAIASSAFVFSILQSVCTVAVAINGVRLVIGAAAFGLTTAIDGRLERFHQVTWLRIALMVGALLGSLLTLWVVFRVRKLRSRPAARWRARPLSPAVRRAERLQVGLAIATLVLVGVEEYLHFRLCHTL